MSHVGLWHRPRATELCIDVDRGTQPLDGELDDLHTRMLLQGQGWSVARFAAAAGMR